MIDKLILRTALEPGNAMVMLDLYARGSHAHIEKGPAVAYYEVDRVPLFHNLGRHATRSAICGNLPWALPAGQPFPGVWKPGRWFTMTIPCGRIERTAEGTHKIADGMTLRIFGVKSCRRLWFDNLRLEGSAGTLLVDGFENVTGLWRLAAKAISSTSSTRRSKEIAPSVSSKGRPTANSNTDRRRSSRGTSTQTVPGLLPW